MLTKRVHKRPFFRKRAIILILLLGMVISSPAMTSSVKLAWDANTEADLVGYNIYVTTRAPENFPWPAQALFPVFVPLYLLEDPDHPSFELFGLKSDTTYFFSVTATNSSGEESSYSNTVSNTAQVEVTRSTVENVFREIPFEMGEVLIDHNWKAVKYLGSFSDPVVIAGPPGSNDPSGVVVRIDCVTDTGFEVSLQEWDYLDGIHPWEKTGYMVMEAGIYSLPDGKRVEADHVYTDKTIGSTPVLFKQPFETIPVVFATVASFNEYDAVSARIFNIDENGFRLQLQEQQANRKAHTLEKVSYVAWEPSRGEFQGFAYTVNTVKEGLASEYPSVFFNPSFIKTPVIIANIQSLDGIDNVVLRWKNKTGTGVSLKLAEEQSLDVETDHLREDVGFMGIVKTD